MAEGGIAANALMRATYLQQNGLPPTSEEARKPGFPLPQVHVPAYLGLFGYSAVMCQPLGRACWKTGADRPHIAINVRQTLVLEGHTWYVMHCRLTMDTDEDSYVEWKALRRLSQIRDGLHAVVKEKELGYGGYCQKFGDTPFAGWSASCKVRTLDLWFGSFCTYINDSRPAPHFVAAVLRFLNAPTRRERLGLSPSASVPPQPDSGRGRGIARGGYPASSSSAQPRLSRSALPFRENDVPSPARSNSPESVQDDDASAQLPAAAVPAETSPLDCESDRCMIARPAEDEGSGVMANGGYSDPNIAAQPCLSEVEVHLDDDVHISTAMSVSQPPRSSEPDAPLQDDGRTDTAAVAECSSPWPSFSGSALPSQHDDMRTNVSASDMDNEAAAVHTTLILDMNNESAAVEANLRTAEDACVEADDAKTPA